jgi:hypothetical protein
LATAPLTRYAYAHVQASTFILVYVHVVAYTTVTALYITYDKSSMRTMCAHIAKHKAASHSNSATLW